MINKKGILMTLGLAFVSLTLLAFANVIVNHSETSEERIKEFGESERLYNLDNSISRTLSRMVMRGMNNSYKIESDGSLIRINAQFSNGTRSYENEIMDQFEIFKNRTERNQNLNFSLRNPAISGNDFPVSIADFSKMKNSSRFYLSNNLNMYIDISTWPENMIYLNGFNETNTESINITIWSQDLQLFMAEEEPTNVIALPCNSCVIVTVNNYYRTNPLEQKMFGIEGASFLFGSNEYFKDVFKVPMIHSSWTENVTLKANWVSSTESAFSFDYWPETTAGLAITLPDIGDLGGGAYCSSKGVYFQTIYYGVINIPAQCLEKNIDIAVEIKLREGSEAAQHEIHFVGSPSYGVGPPLLDTIGSGVRLKYLN